MTYDERVQAYEAKGMTRSDAQGIVDLEDMRAQQKTKTMTHTQGPFEVIEAVGGEWIVLCNGFQWGKGPYDMSGCSSETWKTKQAAEQAIQERTTA